MDDGVERPPAHDVLAEQTVVGAMLLDASVIDDVVSTLMPGDFYQPRHELITQTIVTLARAGKPTDAIAVAHELGQMGVLDKAGGAAYLHELTGVPSTVAQAGYYADIVAKHSARRGLVSAGTRIVAMGEASEGDPDELLELARVEVDRVVRRRRREVHSVEATLDDLIDALDEKPTFFESPWPSLNRVMSGFAPGTCTVVAARPGSGKSIVLLQVAAALARHGSVAFSSLEMTEQELQKRLLAQYGPVSMESLRDHRISDEQWKRVAEARGRLRGAPVFIDDTAAVTLAQIRAHARAVSRKAPLAGICVDYLQLVTGGEGDSRQERVGAVSRGLKQLAKDLGVPVIVAAQLRRAGMRGKSDLPTLEDLRESGSIEQDADCVLLLHRDVKRPSDLEVVVAKQRNGATGRFTLLWDAQFARVLEKHYVQPALIDESEVA